MRATIVRIGATGAGALLVLGLLAGPSAGAPRSDKQSKSEHSKSEQSKSEQNKAERTGKVTCFTPEGKTQGRSFSDPDGMENGGADKPSPGCTGGIDLTDRDGNNGCGNDADREDDNNGNCGGDNTRPPGDVSGQQNDNGKVKTEKVDADVTVQDAGSLSAAGAPAAADPITTAASTEVLGASLTAPAAADTTTPTTTPDTQVLGETLSAPDTLARTGAGIGGLALLGGLLLGGGRLTVLARRFLRIG
ncbi:MAG TPA: hypothetical protein VG795_05205 [Acidimicrobiia bacterium]|nr:hypothetical protein [Acidimicrobiia bacterium]